MTGVQTCALPIWLSSFENIGTYTRYLRRLNGSLNFSLLEVQGPLSDTGEWNVQMKGEGILNEQIGPRLSLDLIKTPEEFVVNSLTIDDEESHATLKGEKNQRSLEINFAGSLKRNTLSRIFSDTYLSDGWFEGDIRAKIILDKPLQSAAEGTLEGQNLISPLILDDAFKINKISIEANKNQLNLKLLDLSLGDTNLAVEGSVTSTEEGFQVMFDASSDLIEWENIKTALDKYKKGKKNKGNNKKTDLRLKGTLRLKSEKIGRAHV